MPSKRRRTNQIKDARKAISNSESVEEQRFWMNELNRLFEKELYKIKNEKKNNKQFKKAN